MENSKATRQKRISLEIAVADDVGEPLATLLLVAYPPAKEMHHFCSFPAHARFGLNASHEADSLFPGALLYPAEVEVVESETSRDHRQERELQYTSTFVENREELLRRFAHLHYDWAFSSIQNSLGKEHELHEVSRSRVKCNGYSPDEALLAFYVVQTCAPLCGEVFNVPYQEVYKGLQKYWGDMYLKTKQDLSKVANRASELIRSGWITLNFKLMERAAARIDGFNKVELQELKKTYGRE